MSENIKGLTNSETVDTYDQILKKEKRLSWVATYAIPIPMFILLWITSFVNKEFPLIVLIIFGLIYIILFPFVLLPLPRKKYGPRRPVRSASVIFEKVGYDRMYLRWEVWSKLHSQYFQFMIFVAAFAAIMISILSFAKTHTEAADSMINFFSTLVFVPALMVINSFFFKAGLTKHNDFGRCCSIGCFRIVTKFQSLDELKKTVYMIDGLKYYDYYIRKNLKLRINNLGIFFSQMIGDSKESVSNQSETILTKLEQGEKLDLLRFLISSSGISKDKPILISEKFSSKLQKWYQFIISVVAVLIAVIQLVK